MRRRTRKSKERLIREAKELEKNRLESGNWIYVDSGCRSQKLVKKGGGKNANNRNKARDKGNEGSS